MAPRRTRFTSRALSELVTTRFEIRKGAPAPAAVPAASRSPSPTASTPAGQRRVDIAEHYSLRLHTTPHAAAAVAARPTGGKSDTQRVATRGRRRIAPSQ